MILFENVKVVSFNPPAVSEAMDVLAYGPDEGGAKAGRVAKVGKSLAAEYPEADRVGWGGYLSPGLVCAHTHLYSALARGIDVPIAPSKDFAQILEHLWWRLDMAIDLPILKASALAGCSDALFCGVTSLVDHHASPAAIDGSLSVIREAYEEVGLRGILCYETTDRNGMEGARAGLAENLRFAREIDAARARGGRPLVDGAIGGHAGFTVGDETLAGMADAVRSTGRGLHIHLAEDKFDAVDSRYRHKLDLVERLDRVGALTPKSVIGHGVWLTPSEVEIMNERDVFLAHNARSNMNNGVGYNSLLTKHRNVVLGTDGMNSDMLEEFKFAVFRHRESGGPWWPGDFLVCLDRGNRLMERYFARDFSAGVAAGECAAVPPAGSAFAFGRIEPGCPADLVLWDYDPPTPLTAATLAGHLAYGLSSRSVRSVAVNGRVRIKDRKAQFDSERIQATAREQARRLWNRMEGK
ncbi:MAG: putative aminohydrolase SsnA [Spirochaetaceae bacterium]|nr:putative aminohydrolase SsnA [Spirochaetaceae bacterium]